MTRVPNPFADAPVTIRPELVPALGVALEQLGHKGDWLDAKKRLAVAREARNAWSCAICEDRKDALSPYAVEGDHDHLDELPEAWVDVIHRVVTDSGRLTESWLRDHLAGGMAEDEYIEIVSVTIITTVIDTFALGIGMTAPDLPEATPGIPDRYRRADASPGPGWVSTIAPEDAAADFADFYDNDSHFYIRRSLTLRPQETRRFWEIMNQLYMEDPRLHELDGLTRGINRAQMEFLAARASMLLGCYY
jgi:hypothetical protein